MSVYVFDSETLALARFASATEALGGREEAPLLAQRWLFFTDDGQPLRVDSFFEGGRHLRPWASCSSCTLAQVMPWISGAGEGLDAASLADLRARLGV